MKKFGLYIILIIFLFLPFSIVYGKKIKIKSITEINFFCRQVQPNNPYCPKWLETQQKLLQLKDFLYKEINKYCEKHKENKFCKEKARRDFSTFCSRIEPENDFCKEWQNLKQLELETKGFLLEKIQNFCQENPLHQFCK
ncbi:MAG: hypothetical protein ACK4Y7_05340 [Caldimicrobium sp.]